MEAENDRLERRRRWEPLTSRDNLEGVRCDDGTLISLQLRSLSAMPLLSRVADLGRCWLVFPALFKRGIRLAGLRAFVVLGRFGNCN